MSTQFELDKLNITKALMVIPTLGNLYIDISNKTNYRIMLRAINIKQQYIKEFVARLNEYSDGDFDAICDWEIYTNENGGPFNVTIWV